MAPVSEFIKELIITPQQAAALSHQYVDRLAAEKGKKIGIPSNLKSLDAILNPLKPGQLRVIMGRPGGGKTSLMMHFSRVAADRWATNTERTTFPPIFISAEMAVEEIMLREMAHHLPVDSIQLERGEYPDWKRVHEAVDELVAERPIIYIGHSLYGSAKRPRISVESISFCIEQLCDDYGMPPELLSIDYAQRLKLDKVTRDRRLEVSEIVETVKDTALRFAVPTNLGSQVSRSVDERKPPVPDLSDAKETANLEETADSMLGTMRPIKYFKEGAKIPGTDLECREELFFINVLKQRQGASGVGVWVYFDMAISRIADLEIERTELNSWQN